MKQPTGKYEFARMCQAITARPALHGSEFRRGARRTVGPVTYAQTMTTRDAQPRGGDPTVLPMNMDAAHTLRPPGPRSPNRRKLWLYPPSSWFNIQLHVGFIEWGRGMTELGAADADSATVRRAGARARAALSTGAGGNTSYRAEFALAPLVWLVPRLSGPGAPTPSRSWLAVPEPKVTRKGRDAQPGVRSGAPTLHVGQDAPAPGHRVHALHAQGSCTISAPAAQMTHPLPGQQGKLRLVGFAERMGRYCGPLAPSVAASPNSGSPCGENRTDHI